MASTSATEWLTTADAMARLQVSRETIRNYRRAGILRTFALGGAGRALRFRASDVDALARVIPARASG